MRPFLGILQLDTRFPRPLGDIGNPASFGFPVRHAIVQGASPQRAVIEGASGLLEPFIAAGLRLVREGAVAITTTCGFLAVFQRELAAALPVPVASSALLLAAEYPRPGVITISADSLTAAHLAGAGVQLDTPIEGVEPGSEFHRRILGNEPTLDLDLARIDVVRAAERLVARHPRIGTIVMECANMPPYREAVARTTAREVVDALTLAERLWLTATRRDAAPTAPPTPPPARGATTRD